MWACSGAEWVVLPGGERAAREESCSSANFFDPQTSKFLFLDIPPSLLNQYTLSIEYPDPNHRSNQLHNFKGNNTYIVQDGLSSCRRLRTQDTCWRYSHPRSHRSVCCCKYLPSHFHAPLYAIIALRTLANENVASPVRNIY